MNIIKNISRAIIVFYLLICGNLYGQNPSVDISRTIPPSPTAASLGNFGNNSKGSYNGVPEISIPLLQVNTGNQNISIGLNYDASGTRASQDASWVGLGWSLLNGGGVITRNVRGLDDLYNGSGYHLSDTIPSQSQILGLYSTSIVTNSPLFYYVGSLRNGVIDCEPDIFTYNFGNHNGKFVFDKANRGSIVNELEGSNLKIIYLDASGWKIIDGEGNSYYFNSREWVEDYSLTTDYEISWEVDATDLDQSFDSHTCTTAWYLDSIVSATSQKIIFTYTTESSMSLINRSEQKFKLIDFFTGTCPPPELAEYNTSRQILTNKVLDKILFDNGSIEFHKANRTDIKTVFGYTGTNYLDDIVEKDNSGTIVKKYKFYYSYFNASSTGDKRLKLDSVQEVTDALSPLPPYRFSYFNPNSLPEKYTKAIDHWGYFNNKSNITLLPAAIMEDPYHKEFPGASRLPDTTLSSVQNGVLSSIIYPTGGKTNFTYELNEYRNLFGDDQYDPRDTTLTLGIAQDGQLDKTVSFVLTETREVTFYFNYAYRADPNYRDEFLENYAFLYSGGSATGTPYETFRNNQPYPNPEITSQTIVLSQGTYTIKVHNITGVNTGMSASWIHRFIVAQRKGGGLRIKRIENFDGLGNKSVKRFLYNQDTLSSGKVMVPANYSFTLQVGGMDPCNDPLNAIYFCRYSNTLNSTGFTNGGVIGYSKVTELSGEQGENGKIEYYFHNEATDFLSMPTVPVLINPLNGKIEMMKIYDAANHLLKKTENSYAAHGESFYSVPGIKLLSIPFSLSSFYILSYPNRSSWITQSEQKETTYAGTDSMVNTVNSYFENVAHKELTKTEQVLSDGGTLTTTYKYPVDFKSSGSPNVYNAMIDRNMVGQLVEQSSSKGGNFLQFTKTNYNYWYNNIWGTAGSNSRILPQTVELKNRTNPSQIRIRYHVYDDSANVLSVSKENDVRKSYIWDYAFQYPVAEVNGADNTSISYSSFEADGKGGWTYSGTTATDVTSPTGSKSYNLSGGNITKSSLTNATYIISYWGKTGSILVNSGGPLLTGRTIGSWTYYEHEITGTSVTISGNKYIDELRLYPKGAQMTTYTYRPLVGMTSQCDQNNHILYYEYDNFSRLKLIKDEDRNIVKRIDYKYLLSNSIN